MSKCASELYIIFVDFGGSQGLLKSVPKKPKMAPKWTQKWLQNRSKCHSPGPRPYFQKHGPWWSVPVLAREWGRCGGGGRRPPGNRVLGTTVGGVRLGGCPDHRPTFESPCPQPLDKYRLYFCLIREIRRPQIQAKIPNDPFPSGPPPPRDFSPKNNRKGTSSAAQRFPSSASPLWGRPGCEIAVQ